MDARSFELRRCVSEFKTLLETYDAPQAGQWNEAVTNKKEELLDILAKQGEPRVQPRVVSW